MAVYCASLVVLLRDEAASATGARLDPVKERTFIVNIIGADGEEHLVTICRTG
jgi:hypothetical protein